MAMKIIEVETKRGDSLFGCWWGGEFKDVCVIITNGTGGNIFENKFLRELGDFLESKRISCIVAHNSGAFQIIDLPSSNNKRSGVTFELFDDCVEDIEAYVDFAKAQGFRRIILGGHSYGCNKVIYYLHKTKCRNIDKYILISPTDTEERTEREKASADKIKKLALKYKQEGKLDEIVPILFDNYNFYSARSFLDYMENPHHQNIPVYHDKANFKQLKNIRLEGLFVMGERDGFAKGDTEHHLKTIYDNCGNARSSYVVIKNAGHTWKYCDELLKVVYNFVCD